MILNQSQMEAVNHVNGPMLILAGPGSGKTATMIHRIISLICNHHISADKICMVTFTKDAAISMQQRYSNSIKNISTLKDNTPFFGTFHSLCYQILKEANPGKNLEILTEKRVIQILRLLYYEFYPEETLDDLLYIDLYHRMEEGIEVQEERIKSFFDSLDSYRRFYKAFETYKRKRCLYDFEDLIKETKKALLTNEKLRNLWQNHFTYYFVDEFQDTDEIQLEILKLLVGDSQNICVVGDDDQSIYGFRGACYEIIKKYLEAYPNAKVVHLFINYRSKRNIVNHSKWFISHNQNRFDKALESNAEQNGAFVIQPFESEEDEFQGIFADIQRRIQNKERYEDMAILCRTNDVLKHIGDSLISYGIPANREKHPDRKPIFLKEDLKALLHLLVGDYDTKDLLVCFSYFAREVSFDYLDEGDLLSDLMRKGKIIFSKQEFVELSRIYEKILFARTLSKGFGLNYLMGEFSLRKQFLLKGRRLHVSEDFILKQLDDISQKSKEINYVELLEELEECFDYSYEKKGIHLLTMHAAKGLEFQTVYLPGLVDGEVPLKRSMRYQGIEEERRLFYVAMTRAKDNLILTYPKKRQGKVLIPSRFIKELFEEKNTSTNK